MGLLSCRHQVMFESFVSPWTIAHQASLLLFLFTSLEEVGHRESCFVMSLNVLPIFSFKSFILSGLTFRSLFNFEFIFVYGVKKCSNFILLLITVAVFLPGESQGRQSLVGCRLWGRTESDMTEAT